MVFHSRVPISGILSELLNPRHSWIVLQHSTAEGELDTLTAYHNFPIIFKNSFKAFFKLRHFRDIGI